MIFASEDLVFKLVLFREGGGNLYHLWKFPRSNFIFLAEFIVGEVYGTMQKLCSRTHNHSSSTPNTYDRIFLSNIPYVSSILRSIFTPKITEFLAHFVPIQAAPPRIYFAIYEAEISAKFLRPASP